MIQCIPEEWKSKLCHEKDGTVCLKKNQIIRVSLTVVHFMHVHVQYTGLQC